MGDPREGLQVAPEAGLEPAPHKDPDDEGDLINSDAVHAHRQPAALKPERSVCGLAGNTFWLVLVIIVLLVCVAIAAGVGGAIAAKQKAPFANSRAEHR